MLLYDDRERQVTHLEMMLAFRFRDHRLPFKIMTPYTECHRRQIGIDLSDKLLMIGLRSRFTVREILFKAVGGDIKIFDQPTIIEDLS